MDIERDSNDAPVIQIGSDIENDHIEADNKSSSQAEDFEYDLCCYMVRSKENAKRIINSGIKPADFVNFNLRNFVCAFSDYFQKYNEIMSIGAWMAKINANRDIKSSDLYKYEPFYRSLLEEDVEQSRLPEVIAKFKHASSANKVMQSVKQYREDVPEYGMEKAQERLINRIQVAKGKLSVKEEPVLLSSMTDELLYGYSEDEVYGFGLPSIDGAGFELMKGKLAMLLGMSGGGKSTVARNVIINNVVNRNAYILVLTCEESNKDFGRKLMMQYCQLTLDDIKKKQYTEDQLKRAKQFERDIASRIKLHHPKNLINHSEVRGLLVDDEGNAIGYDMLIIDHLTHMDNGSGSAFDSHEALGRAMKEFKLLSEEFNLATTVLAQAGRESIQKDGSVKFSVKSVEGSNQPWQACDYVYGVQRDNNTGNTIIDILKNRETGIIAKVTIGFDPTTYTFIDEPAAPSSVKQQVDITKFVMDNMERGNSMDYIHCNKAYRLYKANCEELGTKPLSEILFSKKIKPILGIKESENRGTGEDKGKAYVGWKLKGNYNG